jgi:putative uncharacterized protein (fragment)
MSIINKRILTEDDLLMFCQEQKFTKFNSEDTGYQLALKVPTTFEIDDAVDDSHRGMMKLKIRIFHTGLNRNKSYVSKASAEKAMNTIADRPVLAAIHQLDDGTWDFKGHEVEIVKNDKGKEELRYIESQVGSFSSTPAFWEHDDDLDKDYVCAYAYVSENYTKTCEIIRAKQGTKNSCELFINDLSYNAKEKYLELNDFYVNGSTLLGSEDDGTEIREGMEGSRADIVDFSVENNSIKYDRDEKLIEVLENLNKAISNFDSKPNYFQEKTKKGGNEIKMKKFEELLDKYGKTAEDVTFDYEGMSDAELEEKFMEMFGSDNADQTGINSNNNVKEGGESQQYENLVRTYEISHEDVRYALYKLLAPFEDADNEYYYISNVYDSYFVYEGYCVDKIYRQNYIKDEDSVEFEGERIELFRELLTASEKAELESMRSNYAELKSFKDVTEDNARRAKKEDIINAKKYSVLSKKDSNGNYMNADFAELVASMNDYSVEEFETKVKVLHSDFMAEHSSFAAKETQIEKPTASKKLFTNPESKNTKTSRYGKLFSE